MPLIRWLFDQSGANEVDRSLKANQETTSKLEKAIVRLEKRAAFEEAKKGSDKYQAALKRLQDATKKADKSTKSFGDSLVHVNQGMDLVAKGAQAASALGDFALQGALANDAMHRFTGSMEALTAATQGMVDDTSLQNFADRAEKLGLTAPQVVALADAMTAYTLRAADGSKVIDNLNAAVDGQTRRMRNLGISIDQNSEDFKGLGSASKKTYTALVVLSQAAEDGMSSADEAAKSQASSIYQTQTVWDNFVSTVQQATADELAASGATEDLAQAVKDATPLAVGLVKAAGWAAGEFRAWQEDAIELAETLSGVAGTYIEASDGARIYESAAFDLTGIAGQSGNMTAFANRMQLRINASMIDGAHLTQEQTKALYEHRLELNANAEAAAEASFAIAAQVKTQLDLEAQMAEFRNARVSSRSRGGGAKDERKLFDDILPSEFEMRMQLAEFKLGAEQTLTEASAFMSELTEPGTMWQGVVDIQEETFERLRQGRLDLYLYNRQVEADEAAAAEAAAQEALATQSKMQQDAMAIRIASVQAITGTLGPLAGALGKQTGLEAEMAWVQAGLGAGRNAWMAAEALGIGNVPGFIAHSAAAVGAIANQAFAAKYKSGGGSGGGGAGSSPAVGGSMTGRTFTAPTNTQDMPTQSERNETRIMIDRRVLGEEAIKSMNRSRRYNPGRKLDGALVGATGRAFG